MKTVLVGVTGGIAACKIPELVAELKKNKVNPIVLMSKSAAAIVPPKEFQKISGNKVYTELFEQSFDYKKILKTRVIDHIALAKKASLFVIAPATANCIAKIANGIADDYVTTTVLAVRCPVLIFPSMNTGMWQHPATQENIRKLKKLGYVVFEPSSGKLACGDEGKGRLPEISVIKNEIMRALSKTDDLKRETVIVTAGGTMEKIDDIRYITNKSSGKMGAAIADACYLHGARVILLRAKNSVTPQFSCQEKEFETADDLEQLLKYYLPHADICIHAAAVSDYTIKRPFVGKTSSDQPLPLELTPRTKILDRIKSINPNVFLVAFKAEWNVPPKKLRQLARSRLKKSDADMIIANDVSQKGIGFASDENEVEIIDKNGSSEHVSRAAKPVIAGIIVEHLVNHLKEESA